MDTIKALKENEKPFGLMSAEMQKKAKEIGKGDMLKYCTGDRWEPLNMQEGIPYIDIITYRLRSDYEEPQEGEYELCEIKLDVNGILSYKRKRHCGYALHFAPNHPNFAGYLYKDGVVRHDSLIRRHKVTGEFADCIPFDQLGDYEEVRPYPNGKVLFKKGI